MADEKELVVEEVVAPSNEPEKRVASDRPGRDNRRGPRGERRPRPAREVKEYEERVVSINRVSKTVKGGRRMRFAAVVVIGDGKGRYGYANGKAAEVPDAIKKSLEAAKKNMFRINLVKGDTISHEVIGQFGACRVFLKPAPAGTGIIAGGPVRAILELAGVKNVYSKVYGSRAPLNILRATNNGLENLKSYAQVKALRGLK